MSLPTGLKKYPCFIYNVSLIPKMILTLKIRYLHGILIDIIYEFHDTPLNDDHLKMIKVPKKVEGCRDCLLYIFFINFKISRDALHQFSLRTIRDIKVRYPVSMCKSIVTITNLIFLRSDWSLCVYTN